MRILLIVMLFMSLGLTAQEHPIGIKMGGNMANLSGDGMGDLSSMINFHAGFFMEIGLTKEFKVQPELLFTVYGFKFDEDDNSNNVRLNYIVLPIMGKYFVSDNFSFDFGPQVGLLVSAKNGTGTLADVISDFYDRDFGVNLGGTYTISEKVSASIRYYLGLTDVTSSDSKNFNRALQLAFQFKIN